MARRVYGDRSFRKLLKNMDEGVRTEIASRMQTLGNQLLPLMQASTPTRTGALRAGLSMKFYPRSLRLRVGLIGKPVNKRLYYARIIESGRKSKTVTVRRRTPSGGKTQYALRVKAMPGRHMVYGSSKALRQQFRRNLRGLWYETLQKASRGVSDA